MLEMPAALMNSIRIMSPTIERKREKLCINTERNLSTPLNRYSGRGIIRFEAGLVSVLGREITGNSGGVGTEGLLGNVDGCKGCDGGQKLEGIEG